VPNGCGTIVCQAAASGARASEEIQRTLPKTGRASGSYFATIGVRGSRKNSTQAAATGGETGPIVACDLARARRRLSLFLQLIPGVVEAAEGREDAAVLALLFHTVLTKCQPIIFIGRMGGEEPKKAKPRAAQHSAEVVPLQSAAIPSAQPAKLSVSEALKVVRMLAADTANIAVISHGKKRAGQRKIIRREIELCVQRGTISEGPFVNQRGNWQMNFCRRAAGEEIMRGGDRVGNQADRHHHILRKEASMYHYTESGLDNVFLVDGYAFHKTPYGKGVSIQNTEGLHKVIGRWLVSLPRSLNGAELRFLRLEMEATQRDLAALVGTSEQTLRLWEKHRNKPLPGSPDRLVRAIYSEYSGGDGTIRRMLDRLTELDQVKVGRMRFHRTSSGWKSASLAA
jgi:putative transcriptional regulator